MHSDVKKTKNGTKIRCFSHLAHQNPLRFVKKGMKVPVMQAFFRNFAS